MSNYNSKDLLLIKDSYFTRVNAQHHELNKYETRPHFFAVTDPDNKDILWVIPCTTDKNNKHHDRIAKTNKNSKVYNYTQFEKVLGIEQTLLFEKALPVRESDIKALYKNKNNEIFSLDNPLRIQRFQAIAHEIIPQLKQGKKFSRFQPDQKRIFNQIDQEIKLEKSIEDPGILKKEVAIPDKAATSKFSVSGLKQSQETIDRETKPTTENKKTITK